MIVPKKLHVHLCKIHREKSLFFWSLSPILNLEVSSLPKFYFHSIQETVQTFYKEALMDTVTIKDIARLAGVSCATVSRVLNGTLTVKPENREKILTLCRQYGYRRNLLARSLSAGKTGLIGCILSDLDNPLFAEMSLALEQYARLHDYRVLLCHGRVEDNNIDNLFDFLIGHRVDGIILASSSRQASALIHQYIVHVPIVLQGSLNIFQPDPDISSVCVDSLTGGRISAEYLYQLGHRKVAYLGARENNYSHVFRRKGFIDAAQRLGMSVRDISNSTNSSSTQVGYHLARRFFFDPYQETAIFAACDAIALGVMSAAKELHISIPDDISLMGFDNISYAGLPNIRLSTIDHQAKQVAEAAMSCLLTQIENPKASVQTILIPPVLVERSTCQRC